MADEFAHVWAIHSDPSSGRIVRTDLEVLYARGALLLSLYLAQPVDGNAPRELAIASELTALGEALIRIAQRPEAIIDHRPPDRTTQR